MSAVGGADDEHRRAPAPVGRPDEIEDDADEAVDRDLGHHAAHQRRYVARRGGMGERQPDVQRERARFRSGAAKASTSARAATPAVGVAARIA